MLTADQTRKAMGSMSAMTTDPPYAAIFAFPATFLFPFFAASGSIFTFRWRAVPVPVPVPEDGPNGGPSDARRGAARGEDRAAEGWIAVNADAELTTTTTTRRMDAIDLFMVKVLRDMRRTVVKHRTNEQ